MQASGGLAAAVRTGAPGPVRRRATGGRRGRRAGQWHHCRVARTASPPSTVQGAPARWTPPGRAAARWRGALLLVPLVVALHAAVVFGAWRAAERAPGRTATLPLQAASPAPRELRVVARSPLAGDADTAAPAVRDAPDLRDTGAGAPLRAEVSAAATVSPDATTATPVSPSTTLLTALPTAQDSAEDRAAPTRPAAAQAPASPPGATPTPTATPGATAAVAPGVTQDRRPAAPPADEPPRARTAPAETLATPSPAAGRTEEAPVREPAASPEAVAAVSTAAAAVVAAAATAPRTPASQAASAGSGTAASAAPPTLPSLPVYRGEAPPPATLHFSLRRAAVTGRGQLDWRPGPEGYELTLQATVLGLRALQQTSRGRWDLGGLAPERFLDTRRGRETRAANFRHDVGLISYSGPSQTYPLLRGSQDRLSWMLHLPAVMQANPALRVVGAELRMFVSGARGDGDVWAFRVLSADRIAVPAGEVQRALHLQRLPRQEHDTQADIWLDPARHHLPVRVRLQSGDDVFDLVLDRLEGG